MTSKKPPFIKIPPHVDANALYAAAERLEQRINSHILETNAALASLPVGRESVGYWAEWFNRKTPNVLSYLQVYAYIIGRALPPGVSLANVRMLDFGAGWGLMGMLAKEAGVGRVTYLDIHPGITSAVRLIGETMRLPLDAYLCGNETVLRSADARFNCVVSSDVIEHVYKPERVFREIAAVCDSGTHVFHHTGANPKSPHQRYVLQRLHRQEEPILRAARRDVIAASGINGENLERLAVTTRGLDRADIEAAIKQFGTTGRLPAPDHATNTCELSGYWLERLMDPYRVAEQMTNAGFRTRVTQCFWGPGRSSLAARALKHALNFASSTCVPIGLRVTFYYGLHGVKA